MTAATALLAATALDTYYGDSHILRGAAIEIPARTAVGLLGRNGMGKTTLIRTLMGFVRPAAGEVRWQGRGVTGDRSRSQVAVSTGPLPS